MALTEKSELKKNNSSSARCSVSQEDTNFMPAYGTVCTPDVYILERPDDNRIQVEEGEGVGGNRIYHCHSDPVKPADSKARRVLIIAACICLLFMIAEIIGGLLAGSLAIITDAAHLLTDFASFLISIFSLFVASKPATKSMSFGFHRAEVLGALVSVLLIWVVTGILVYIAVERIMNKSYEIDAPIMLITAAIGVCVNIIMAILLHFGGGHGHSHGGGSVSPTGGASDHSHSKNINVRAAFIHVIGDFLQSIGVFIAALLIYFKPSYAIADPICTFIFSLLVLATTLAVMRDTLNVLMEGLPKGINFNEVLKSLEEIDGVVKAHDLRIWALTLNKVALSVHLAVDQVPNAQTILANASYMLRSSYSIYESTVQIETYQTILEECTQCEPPKR